MRRIDQKSVSDRAQLEVRRREVHLPPTGVYRWWARRTDAASGAMIDAVARELGATGPMVVADAFAGGGVIALSARKRGHFVYAQDLNPWATFGLATTLGLPDPDTLQSAAKDVLMGQSALAATAYASRFDDGAPCRVAHSLRVACANCSRCGARHRMFPHALVSLVGRRDSATTGAYLACRHGHLHRVENLDEPRCRTCDERIDPQASYLPGRLATCPECGHTESLAARASGSPWSWDLVLIERSDGRRRELSPPSDAEHVQADGRHWRASRDLGAIPDAAETRVLRTHGFTSWNHAYPRRQQCVTERLLSAIAEFDVGDRIRDALSAAAIGTTEMAGHLSRWDRYYLKSYEAMASHRFNLTTLSVEPNVLGQGVHGRGSFSQRAKAAVKAARWIAEHVGSATPPVVATRADAQRMTDATTIAATVVTGSSERLLLPDGSVDLVMTDPPYHDDVQYHELSLPFRAWAGLDTGRPDGEAIAIPHSHAINDHRAYREILTRVFEEMRRVMKPTGRLVFSYANREPAAWTNLFAALSDAGLRPVGYTILHAENELDHAKRSRRACTLDLMLELVDNDNLPIAQWRPAPFFGTDEERYLIAAGDAFLDSCCLLPGWEREMLRRLAAQPFVSKHAKRKGVRTEA